MRLIAGIITFVAITSTAFASGHMDDTIGSAPVVAFDGKVLVDAQGNVSVESRGGYKPSPTDPPGTLAGLMFDQRPKPGNTQKRLTVENGLLTYLKDGIKYPVAKATGEKVLARTTHVHDVREHEVFKIDPSYTGKIVYDEIEDRPFMWVVTSRDMLRDLPIVEYYESSSSDDPWDQDTILHRSFSKKREIIEQIRLAKSGKGFTLDNLPKGPLFDHNDDVEVCGLTTYVYIPVKRLDKDVLVGVDGYSYNGAFDQEPRLEWLTKHGFVKKVEFEFRRENKHCD